MRCAAVAFVGGLGKAAARLHVARCPTPDLDEDMAAIVVGLALHVVLHRLELPHALQHDDGASGRGLREPLAVRAPWPRVRRGTDRHSRHGLLRRPGHCADHVRALREGDLEVRGPPTRDLGRGLVHPAQEAAAVLNGKSLHKVAPGKGRDEAFCLEGKQLTSAHCLRAPHMDPLHPKGALGEPTPSANPHRARLLHGREPRHLRVQHLAMRDVRRRHCRPAGEEDVVVPPDDNSLHDGQHVIEPSRIYVPQHQEEGLQHYRRLAHLRVQSPLQRLAEELQRGDVTLRHTALVAETPPDLSLHLDRQAPADVVLTQEAPQQAELTSALLVGQLQVHHHR
mmetsp:Transcript_29751/g.85600  ORF Transcript_29751/g.85600 Transcript_29751/m.85600 type:complete len:339 (-) Transcript_29751:1250-2266(-)